MCCMAKNNYFSNFFSFFSSLCASINVIPLVGCALVTRQLNSNLFVSQRLRKQRNAVIRSAQPKLRTMDDYGPEPVQLYIYDLSAGAAALMSGMLLGRHIEGIWHTAVVVHGHEYFYGGQGIRCVLPVS